jgi:riboflavin kinase / FMN adenylyltransferase
LKVLNQERIKPGELGRTVCTIGNFDGVHLGHQKILSRVADVKAEENLTSVVITFDPHPVRVLNPDKGLKLIFDHERKIQLLERYEPDVALICEFTVEMSKTPAEKWVREVLTKQLGARHLIVGYDFNFGRGGDGNAAHLAELGKNFDFKVEQVDAVQVADRVVSSSRIRRLVSAGEAQMVSEMLGRPFYLAGKVVSGQNRGATIGFPTANLSTQQDVIPAKGVYAALVKVPQGVFSSAVNIGCNPTFANGGLSIEAHLMDFEGDLYGADMEIHFLRRLRDEMRYDSVDRLVEQIGRDVDQARQYTDKVDREIITR